MNYVLLGIALVIIGIMIYRMDRKQKKEEAERNLRLAKEQAEHKAAMDAAHNRLVEPPRPKKTPAISVRDGLPSFYKSSKLSSKAFYSKFALSDKGYVAFDFETTGLDPMWRDIIEIGAVRVRSGEIVERFSQMIKPFDDISNEITKLTGITPYMVHDAPSLSEALPAFLNFIGDDVIIAHNASRFDMHFLAASLERCGLGPISNKWTDSIFVVRDHLELDSYKLSACADAVGYNPDTAHRALSDAETIYHIIQGIGPAEEAVKAEEQRSYEEAMASSYEYILRQPIVEPLRQALKENMPCRRTDIHKVLENHPNENQIDWALNAMADRGELKLVKINNRWWCEPNE